MSSGLSSETNPSLKKGGAGVGTFKRFCTNCLQVIGFWAECHILKDSNFKYPDFIALNQGLPLQPFTSFNLLLNSDNSEIVKLSIMK